MKFPTFDDGLRGKYDADCTWLAPEKAAAKLLGARQVLLVNGRHMGAATTGCALNPVTEEVIATIAESGRQALTFSRVHAGRAIDAGFELQLAAQDNRCRAVELR